MTEGPDAGSGLSALAARLDEDIAEAERRVAEAERRVVEAEQHAAQLRGMRENIEQLIKYAKALNGSSVQVQQPLSPSGRKSFTDQVIQVFLGRASDALTIDEVNEYLREAGSAASVSSVRNAVYYAANSGRLEKKGRGRFALKDSSTPVGAGVEVEVLP